jgi:hypothetical protein
LKEERSGSVMRKGLDQWLDKLILKFRAPKWEGETVVTVRLKKRRSKVSGTNLLGKHIFRDFGIHIR